MKKIVILLLIVPLWAACAHLRESDSVDPGVQGTWAGEGRFLDRHLEREYGRFPVTLEIHADNTVSGSVGGASLTQGTIKSRPEDLLIEARLTGSVFAAGSLPDEKKDCIVFILKPPQQARAEGNIHLKTNHTFDLNMRVGGVVLSRPS